MASVTTSPPAAQSDSTRPAALQLDRPISRTSWIGTHASASAAGCLIQKVTPASAPLAHTSAEDRGVSGAAPAISPRRALAERGRSSSISLLPENPCTDGAAEANAKNNAAQTPAARPAMARASSAVTSAVATHQTARKACSPRVVGGATATAIAYK